MKELPVLLIAGINNLGCIGDDNGGLIVNCPRDLQRFKELSTGGVLIVGRKTYESLPAALALRSYVVVSESCRKDQLKHPKNVAFEDVVRVSSLDKALNAAFDLAAARNRTQIVIAGGRAIYDHFLYDAERLFITRFDNDEVSLTRFPLEKFESALSDGRFTELHQSEFYQGDMKVEFFEYALAPCIESVIGGFVKLRNGVRFRLSTVNTYMMTDECLLVAQEGFAFKVYSEDMNLSQLISELDEIVSEAESSGVPSDSENILNFQEIRIA